MISYIIVDQQISSQLERPKSEALRTLSLFRFDTATGKVVGDALAIGSNVEELANESRSKLTSDNNWEILSYDHRLTNRNLLNDSEVKKFITELEPK